MELRDDHPLHRALRSSERAAGQAVLRMLRQELGLVRALRVLGRVALDHARGEPFRALGPPEDRRDELTRRQLGPAVLLSRALRRQVDTGRAEQLTARAIEAGGLVFLAALLGDLDPRKHAGAVGREVRERVARFFNAEGSVAIAEDAHEVRFTVERCRFVELAPRVGAAALMPAFCAVDEAYFRSELTPLRLRRDHTLGRGDRACDFRFHWDDE